MARLIKRTQNNYTNVSNQVIRDERLSWKARGIFVYLWSQADNWQFYVSEVAKHATDGRESLQNGLKELEEFGYLKRINRQETKVDVFQVWIGFCLIFLTNKQKSPLMGKSTKKAQIL